MTRGGAILLAFVAGASALGAAPGVRAQTRPARSAPAPKPLALALSGGARADYDAGKTLAGDGDFVGALIKFQGAYDQSKDPRLLWNVAFCEKNLRHYATVIATLQRYLTDGAGYLTDKDRKDAQDLIATLQPFTTSATVVVNQEGAQIVVDGTAVGVSPLPAPVVLDIGERHVRVTKDGFRPFEKTIPVGGSAAVTVDVALEKEVHEGHLVVNAPAGAALTLDDRPIGTGRFDGTVPAGGHQLRATAPGMRPYQTEVVVQDKETRQLDIMLEKDAAPEKPKLRVAIGCDGPEPRGPEDGLVLYLDGPDVLPPANVKRSWDDAQARNVVQYVEYAVDAGKHTVRARIPECESLETTVAVDAQAGGRVAGALVSDTPLLLKGPEGSPGRWRIGAGLWMFSPAGQYQNKDMTESYQGDLGSATGFDIGAAVVWRWAGLFLDVANGYGSMKRSSFDTHDALPATASTSVAEGMLRASFRVPFNVVSWNVIGAEGGLAQVNLKDVNTGPIEGEFGAWSGLDVQPLCDWGVRALADVHGLTDVHGGPGFGLQLGVFFEPNGLCRRERATRFGLREGEASP